MKILNEESQKVYSRELKEEHFKKVEEMIKGGKADDALFYPELQEELVEKFKGKTVGAVIEVIFTSFNFLTVQEMVSMIEVLKGFVVMTFRSELLKKARNRDSAIEDIMAKLSEKESKKKENTTTEKHELFS